MVISQALKRTVEMDILSRWDKPRVGQVLGLWNKSYRSGGACVGAPAHLRR